MIIVGNMIVLFTNRHPRGVNWSRTPWEAGFSIRKRVFLILHLKEQFHADYSVYETDKGLLAIYNCDLNYVLKL